jgi:hypothetical protein
MSYIGFLLVLIVSCIPFLLFINEVAWFRWASTSKDVPASHQQRAWWGYLGITVYAWILWCVYVMGLVNSYIKMESWWRFLYVISAYFITTIMVRNVQRIVLMKLPENERAKGLQEYKTIDGMVIGMFAILILFPKNMPFIVRWLNDFVF